MEKTVSFHTLGCKVNQYETQAMTELFENAGYKVLPFDSICDVYVVNTCTVTGTGDKKSRQIIRRCQGLNPQAVIVVAGCYSQVAPEEISAMGVDVVLGNKDKSNVVALTEEAILGKKSCAVSDILKCRTFEDMSISNFNDKTRAFVKIEDGCNSFCTYCLIPYARGPVRSRDIESIVNEVKSLSESGFAEVVLTGIHIASYGLDIKDSNLTLYDVIRYVHEIEGIKRIRLGSIEPRILTEEFVKKISELPKVCHHFHISLQSGCDETLKRMNRKYDTALYSQVVQNIRKYMPESAITTDIMAGFPGETEEEFKTSVAFLEEICFAESHVFAYSNRKGTKADKMPNQVKRKDKNRRASIMAEAAKRCREKFLNSFKGEEIEVLIEREVEKSIYEGHTSNYIKVHVSSEADISRKFVKVKIIRVFDEYVLGEMCDN